MSGFKELLEMFSGMMKPKRNEKTAKKKSEYKYKNTEGEGMNLNQRQKRKRWASNPHLRP